MPVLAQTPAACPDAPPAYSGTDVVVSELREQRAELAASCAATIERYQAVLDRLGERLDVALPAGPLEVALPAGPLDVAVTGQPLDVAVTNPGEAPDQAPVIEAVESTGNTVRAALWFLAGLSCIAIAAGVIRREFAP